MDWRLRVCWLLVQRQVFVGLMYFGGDGLRISHRMEVLRGYDWKMRMLWMLILREILISSNFFEKLNLIT